MGPFAKDIYTFGLDLDMSWDLPNETRSLQPVYPQLQDLRRDRRDVYLKLESLFSAWVLYETQSQSFYFTTVGFFSAGFEGRACVLRSMCEVSRRLGPQGSPGGLVEELLKLVFTWEIFFNSVHLENRFNYKFILQNGENLQDLKLNLKKNAVSY